MATATAGQARFSLTGDKRFREVLKRLDKPASNAIHTRALKKVGRAIQHRARTGYLSGNPLRKITGDLYNSVVATTKRPHDYISVGSPLEQAMPLHFGWPAHNLRPRPWLHPAAEEIIPGMATFWIVEMERELRGV